MVVVMVVNIYKTNMCHKCATLIWFIKDADGDDDADDEDL